jgi:nitrous oxide reductase accessory protein NosL
MIRTRPGAGFITILAILAILNILVLAAGCSSDRKTTSAATQQLSQAQLAAVAAYVWSLSHT